MIPEIAQLPSPAILLKWLHWSPNGLSLINQQKQHPNNDDTCSDHEPIGDDMWAYLHSQSRLPQHLFLPHQPFPLHSEHLKPKQYYE